MTAPITSARVRELGAKENAWTALGGTYPPYINVTGRRLTVRGPATVGSIAEQFLVKPGRVVAFDLPDSQSLDSVALALCSEPARNRIADALDLLERVERQDAGLVRKLKPAVIEICQQVMEQLDGGPAVNIEGCARAALAALVGRS